MDIQRKLNVRPADEIAAIEATEAARLRALRQRRLAKVNAALKRWQTRYKRAKNKVKELERRATYYKKVLS